MLCNRRISMVMRRFGDRLLLAPSANSCSTYRRLLADDASSTENAGHPLSGVCQR